MCWSSALLDSWTGYNGATSAKVVNDRQVLLFIGRSKDTSNQNPIGINIVINFNNVKKNPKHLKVNERKQLAI